MVDHELLLKKHEAYGIVNTELKWCRSYLTGRKQVVQLNGKESSEALMEYGVRQGSILGPLRRKGGRYAESQSEGRISGMDQSESRIWPT